MAVSVCPEKPLSFRFIVNKGRDVFCRFQHGERLFHSAPRHLARVQILLISGHQAAHSFSLLSPRLQAGLHLTPAAGHLKATVATLQPAAAVNEP